MRATRQLLFWTALLAALVVLHHVRRHPAPHPTAAPALAGEPKLVLWAWESPEDLTALDPRKAAVAFLSREVLLDEHAQLRLRRQPLQVAPETFLIATVRIETGPRFKPTEELAANVAQMIAAAIEAPNIRALQVDFDATASQRNFYASVLKHLREQLPKGFPLSITALVSWCGPNSWLHGLPVDEAVPMLFRMGGGAVTRATAPRSLSGITEALCTGSAGIATDEAWPAISPQQRVYVFRPGSWTKEELAKINAYGYQSLKPHAESLPNSQP